MTEPDLDRLEDGFYWISIDGQAAEVAQWQLEWGQWLVAGSTRPLPDGWSTRVTVLSDRLFPPTLPVSDSRTTTSTVKIAANRLGPE